MQPVPESNETEAILHVDGKPRVIRISLWDDTTEEEVIMPRTKDRKCPVCGGESMDADHTYCKACNSADGTENRYIRKHLGKLFTFFESADRYSRKWALGVLQRIIDETWELEQERLRLWAARGVTVKLLLKWPGQYTETEK